MTAALTQSMAALPKPATTRFMYAKKSTVELKILIVCSISFPNQSLIDKPNSLNHSPRLLLRSENQDPTDLLKAPIPSNISPNQRNVVLYAELRKPLRELQKLLKNFSIPLTNPFQNPPPFP